MGIISHDSETPAHGQQVITACAFIWHDFDGIKKAFMPMRAATKKFLPNVYELPGGHIDFGENIVEGLKREIKEELNMTAEVGDPFAAFGYQNEIKGSHSAEIIYFATFVEPIEKVTIQPEDHSRYDWFTREEVIAHKDEMLDPNDSYDEQEYQAVLKGFDLLAGALPDFAAESVEK